MGDITRRGGLVLAVSNCAVGGCVSRIRALRGGQSNCSGMEGKPMVTYSPRFKTSFEGTRNFLRFTLVHGGLLKGIETTAFQLCFGQSVRPYFAVRVL